MTFVPRSKAVCPQGMAATVPTLMLLMQHLMSRMLPPFGILTRSSSTAERLMLASRLAAAATMSASASSGLARVTVDLMAMDQGTWWCEQQEVALCNASMVGPQWPQR